MLALGAWSGLCIYGTAQCLVKWFNNAKGYGFLGNEGGSDVFCRYSAIQREGYKTLKEGDPVAFDVVEGEKEPQADNVIVDRHPKQ